MARKTAQEFIDQAKRKHGEKFDYSEVEYINTHTPVKIRCNQCGLVFLQEPSSHLAGRGCPKCSKKQTHKRVNQDMFIARAREVHGDKYDYSKKVNAERKKKKGSFADNFPERVKNWDYEKNGELLPSQVTAGSNIKVYWKCHVCGYEWNGMVITQAKAKYSCKKCANRERPLKRFGNKPLVETHPQLAEEWDYKNNGDLTPYNITAHFHKRVNWICHKGHHWPAFVSVRANKNIGCPHCKKEWGTSFPEQAIYFYLRKVTNAQNRYIFKGVEIDFF